MAHIQFDLPVTGVEMNTRVHLRHISKRTPSAEVGISVWEGKLSTGMLQLRNEQIECWLDL